MRLVVLLAVLFCGFAIPAETLHEWKFTDQKVPGFNPLRNLVSFQKSGQKTPDGEPAGEVCILNEPARNATPWSVQLNFQSEQEIECGVQYQYSFWVKSDRDAVFEASFLQAVTPWKNFGKSKMEISAGKEWKKVSCKTVSNYDYNGNVRVMLVCGTLPKGITLTIGPIKLEKISGDVPAAVSPTEFLDSVGSVGAVYTDAQSPRFSARTPFPAETWTLENRRQEQLAYGKWNPERDVILEPLVPGYYFLKLASGQATVTYPFCVVKDPAKRRPAPDSPYAIDSAISWCATADKQNPVSAEPKFEFAAELIRLGGFPMARDRFSWRWSVTQDSPDKIVSPEYDRCGKLLAERGIPRLNVFHDSPEWTRTKQDKLPRNLGALYQFCRALAVKNDSAAWEFWNEPDIGFSVEPVWEFAAAQKAAYLGFKAGNPELPVLAGALCKDPPGAYADAMLENGLAPYFDLFNYHTYTGFRQIPFLMKKIHELLRKNGAGDVAVWFTENNTQQEGPARADSVRADLKAHDAEQEMLVAEFIPKAQILLHSFGVARIFFFQLCAFNEQNGNKDWGLYRRDFTVKPGFAVLSTLNDVLGNARLLGEWNAPHGARAFLFAQPDGTQTLAFWKRTVKIDQETAEIADMDFEIPAEGECTLVDSFGTEQTITPVNGKIVLKAERFASYLNGLSDLEASQPAISPGRVGAVSTDADKTIVIVPRLPRTLPVSAEKTDVNFDGTQPLDIEVEVWNFSDQVKRGKLRVTPAEAVREADAEFEIAPFGKSVRKWTLLPFPQGRFRLEIDGVFNGKNITRAVVRFFSPEKSMEKAEIVPMPRSGQTVAWQENSSGSMTVSAVDGSEAIRFEAKFPPERDRWLYPVFRLQLPQETLAGTSGIQFEIRLEDKTEAKFSLCYLDQERLIPINFKLPSHQWETRTIFFDPALVAPEQIKAIRIGMNPLTDDAAFSIRNVRVFTYR